jgi:hypothetical protein
VTYKDISEATGLTVRWLEVFSSGSVANPGVVNVETLYNHLAITSLSVG